MSGSEGSAYAGDVSVRIAWDALATQPTAVLVDVRSKAEWVLVGVPVLSSIGKAPVLVAWNDFGTGQVIPDFIDRLSAALNERGVGQDASLFFLCRSGNRSRHAAIAATVAGYAECFNLEHGFEGHLDSTQHRGTPGSWKAEGLPWEQS
ncbi:rhodanese-like domain-containing protein [Bauldia sp.]|uniref:rhodanese-like domain-containing protein n=1 Tax=Bauldia sp. TaxID=2575872 RepID=UPI003BAD54A8